MDSISLNSMGVRLRKCSSCRQGQSDVRRLCRSWRHGSNVIKCQAWGSTLKLWGVFSVAPILRSEPGEQSFIFMLGRFEGMISALEKNTDSEARLLVLMMLMIL